MTCGFTMALASWLASHLKQIDPHKDVISVRPIMYTCWVINYHGYRSSAAIFFSSSHLSDLESWMSYIRKREEKKHLWDGMIVQRWILYRKIKFTLYLKPQISIQISDICFQTPLSSINLLLFNQLFRATKLDGMQA
ncbi:hypothetical protein ACJX0J_029994, partial [Zea mays]